jgi:hypothetical protein
MLGPMLSRHFPLSAAKAGERWEAVVSEETLLAPTASHLTRLAALGTLSPAFAAERGKMSPC